MAKEIKVLNGESVEDAINKANACKEPVTVFISEGEYEVESTLVLKHDGIKIVGENNNVILKGCKRISISGLEKDENGIVTVDLRKSGVVDTGKFGEGPYEEFWTVYDIPKPHLTDYGPGMELFCEKGKMPISRYPKEGFINIKKALGKTDTYFNDQRNGSEEGIFLADDEEIGQFKDFKDIMLIGYWQYDWATQRHMIENIDHETGAIEIKKPYHCYGYRDGRALFYNRPGIFYALNVREKISEPGEWAVDRDNLLLYVYPFEGQEYVEVSLADDLIYANGCKDIGVSGVKISECRKSGILFENCVGAEVFDVNVKDVGAWGILGENCEKMSVCRCEVSYTGGGGIGLSGGDRQMLISSENLINKCTVHNIAVWHKTYMAALDIGGVGCVASENLIYDVPHFGIVFSGNEHIMEKNEIDNACYESNDAGAIYSGRNYTYRGNIIRYNYIHDLYGHNKAGCMGVYFDDGMSSAEVYGNIFANMPHAAILLGGGRDFKIYNNTFFNCKMALDYDKRIMTIERMQRRLQERLKEVDYKSDVWKKAYPKLYDILENDVYMPLGNEVYDNTVIGGDGFALEAEDVKDVTVFRSNKFVGIDKNAKRSRHKETWFYIQD